MMKDPHEKKVSEELNSEKVEESLESDLTTYPFLHEDLMDEYDKWF